MKTCIICNPLAGGTDHAEETTEKLRALDSATVHLTSAAGDATAMARAAVAEGFETIVAAGGDGTLNEIINGIAPHSTEVRVGLIPLGTGNDFARMLSLPSSVEECLDVVRARNTRVIDLVRVTSDEVRYFVNVSAGGFSGIVNEQLTPELKQTWGPLAYLRGAAAALPELHAYRTTITLDDHDSLELDLYNIIVANGRFVAGGTPVAPEAEIDDGLLDVVLVPNRPGSEIAVMVAQMLVGAHLSSDAIVFRRAAKVGVESRPGMWFNVDGELVGNEPATFEIIPRALQFLVPVVKQ